MSMACRVARGTAREGHGMENRNRDRGRNGGRGRRFKRTERNTLLRTDGWILLAREKDVVVVTR